MKYFEVKEGLIIKSWCNNPDENSIEQAKNLARLPFAFKQICLMPDVHVGYGMPIGGVLATRGVVISNAIGKDIGCGMCAQQTSLKVPDIETVKKIVGEIRKIIPVGRNWHKEKQEACLMPAVPTPYVGKYTGEVNDLICYKEWEDARKQLGTLGGGK